MAVWLFVAISVVAVGCGPETQNLPGAQVIDVSLERAIVGDLMSKWEGALEAYNVSGMLAPISPDVVVQLRENGVAQAAKDYQTLKNELESNAPNQLRMRSEDGYDIDINFSLVVDVSVSGTAQVIGTFAATESIKGVNGTLIYETGTISVQLSKVGSVWLMRSVDLNFNVPLT